MAQPENGYRHSDAAAVETPVASRVGQAMQKDDLRLFDHSGTPACIGGVVDEHVMLRESGRGDRARAVTH